MRTTLVCAVLMIAASAGCLETGNLLPDGEETVRTITWTDCSLRGYHHPDPEPQFILLGCPQPVARLEEGTRGETTIPLVANVTGFTVNVTVTPPSVGQFSFTLRTATFEGTLERTFQMLNVASDPFTSEYVASDCDATEVTLAWDFEGSVQVAYEVDARVHDLPPEIPRDYRGANSTCNGYWDGGTEGLLGGVTPTPSTAPIQLPPPRSSPSPALH